jgi:hypothetical protein
MVKKMSANKDFNNEGFNQGSKKLPMKQVKEYGTGLKVKKPKPKMARKK